MNKKVIDTQSLALYFNGSKIFFGKVAKKENDVVWFFSKENSFYSWVNVEDVNKEFKTNKFGLIILNDVISELKASNTDKTIGFNKEEKDFLTSLYDLCEIELNAGQQCLESFGSRVSARIQYEEAVKKFNLEKSKLLTENEMGDEE